MKYRYFEKKYTVCTRSYTNVFAAGGSFLREESFHFTESEEKILQAALQVVSEKTISGTRMHLIAEHAGMVQSNVHYYYKTKQELLLGLQERVLEEFYSIRRMDRQRSGDTLEEQIHIFFRQKKHMILEKEAYDFAELNFLVHSKMDEKIRERFRQSYAEWREDIREVLSRFCPDMDRGEKEQIPYLTVSLLEGASIQFLVEGREFDADRYFTAAEEMILQQIRKAEKSKMT